jgi:hypothetical protein
MGFSFTDIVETLAGGLGYEAFFAGDRRAARASRRAHRAEAESRRVSGAQQENERQAAIRKQVREERVRRAQVMSAAEASGVGGSSIEASTIGSGQTLAAAGQAFSSGATISANLQSDLLQGAADFRAEGQKAMARQKMFRTAFDIGVKAVTAGAG